MYFFQGVDDVRVSLGALIFMSVEPIISFPHLLRAAGVSLSITHELLLTPPASPRKHYPLFLIASSHEFTFNSATLGDNSAYP